MLSGEETISQLPCCLHAELSPHLGPGNKESWSCPHHGHGPSSWLFLKEGKNFISEESLKTQQFVQTNGLAPRSRTHLCTLGCCLTNSPAGALAGGLSCQLPELSPPGRG